MLAMFDILFGDSQAISNQFYAETLVSETNFSSTRLATETCSLEYKI